MINHQNFGYSSNVPVQAGDRYYGQDLGRDFYFLQDALGLSLLSGFGQAPGTPLLTQLGAVSVDGVTPNSVIDVGAGASVLPFSISVPNSFAAIPPTVSTVTVNLPIIWPAQTVNVTTLGCTGTQVYKLYATYTETVQKTRQKAKQNATYGYEVLPTLTFGVTTGSIPANSVLIQTFTYNAGSSPITGLINPTIFSFSSPSFTSNIITAVTESGLTWDPTDSYILSKANIALSHQVGEDVFMNAPLAQTYFSAARSSANPGNPQYCPVISRAVDKTITNAMSTPLVTWGRAFAVSVLGTTVFTMSVSGSNITFANSTVNNQLLTALSAEAFVRQWLVSQDANFAGTGPLYTGMSINVNGTEFAITNINLGTRVVTVTGSPSAGATSCSIFPYRIVGSSTSIFLPRQSGFVPVGSDDVDGFEVGGLRHMDQGQGHFHGLSGGGNVVSTASSGFYASGPFGSQTSITGPITDGTNGTPRTGKTNNPRSAAKFQYIWAGVLTAAA